MNTIKKLVSIVLIFTLLLTCACSKKSDVKTNENVEITFWHSYSEGEEKIFKDVVLKNFSDKHPNIKVNAVRMPYEGLDEQLITAVSGDVGPDVMRMDLTWVSQMAKLGALECLDEYDDFDATCKDILESSMKTTLYKGKHYGLPINANTTVAVYNNTLLKDYGLNNPPKTMDELMAALDKCDAKNKKWLFAVSGSYNWAMLPFIWTLGGNVTDDNYTKASGYLNSKETVAAVDTIIGWYKNGIIGPAIMGEQPDAWGGIEAGNYSMIVEGPWFFSDEDKMTQYTPALMPSVDGRSISIVGGEDLVMTSNSKKKDAAWTFMKFLLEDEQQIAMKDAGMIPVTSSAMSKVDTSSKSYVDVYMEQLKTAKERIPCSCWPQIEVILNTAFESALREEKTSQDALDSAAKEIDALLEQE